MNQGVIKFLKATQPAIACSHNINNIANESRCYQISKSYPAGNCMFKVNNRNTRTRCEICSKLTIKTPERR